MEMNSTQMAEYKREEEMNEMSLRTETVVQLDYSKLKCFLR